MKGRPFTFYKNRSFEVIGLLPDMNGFGKPNVSMVKPIVPDK